MRTIPDPGFAGDDGSADQAETAALGEVAGGAPLEVAVAALCASRVLVPVVAVPSEATADDAAPEGPVRGPGPGEEKSTDMAAVLMTGRDGRQALLAFSSLDSLRTWDAQARPVPVTTTHAAQAALSEGAEALVVDVAGPVQVPIEGAALRRIAEGQRLVRIDEGFGWALPS